MPKAPKTWQPIDLTFTGPVTTDNDGPDAWQCVHLADSKTHFGTGNPVKFKGTVDDIPYEATFMPNGKGAHMFPLRAAFRKQIGKTVGDTVTVHLTEFYA